MIKYTIEWTAIKLPDNLGAPLGGWSLDLAFLLQLVVNGLALGIANWPEGLENPAWTTAAGLAMYSARLKARRPQKRKGGLMGLVSR